MKLDPGSPQVLSSLYLPMILAGGGVTALSTDAQNNLVIFGQTNSGGFQATPGAYTSPQPVSYCNQYLVSLNDALVIKLRALDWQPIYGATLAASCGIQTGSLVIDKAGAVILAMKGAAGLPSRSPLLAGPSCLPNVDNSSAVAKLSADGSSLQFSTYLDNCGLPAIALAGDESIYASVSPTQGGDETSVLRLNPPSPRPLSIDQISNAFSGDASAVVGGGLYTISVPGFQGAAVNLGVNPSQDLPFQLSGVEVKFDGVPAAILSVAPGQIIVAPPVFLGPSDTRGAILKESLAKATAFTSVQLTYNNVSSNPVWMPVSESLPGVLTLDYPNWIPGADGNVRNQDGTPNSATNPAAAGSTITLFATGLGATNPAVAPGSVARASAVSLVTPVYSSWETATRFQLAPPESASLVSGFVSAMFQVQVQVPSSQAAGRVLVGLQLVVPQEEHDLKPPSNSVAVYVN